MSILRADSCTCPGGEQVAAALGHVRSDCPHFGDGEMTFTPALKPCPFCGSGNIGLAKKFVFCRECSAEAGFGDGKPDVAAWNTRASTASEAERVREACAKVAEEFHCSPQASGMRDVVASSIRIAAAIRSLPIGEA